MTDEDKADFISNFKTIVEDVNGKLKIELAQFLNLSIYMSNALKKEIQRGFLVIFKFVSDIFVRHVLFI